MLNERVPEAPLSPQRSSRVMIIDDSVVVRGLVSRWISDAHGFEVVASARNGRVALDCLAEAKPDIVLLDLDMPELDGIETLPLLMARLPSVSVIVVSTLTKRNAEISLRCLSLGAIDYLTKPSTQHEVATSEDFRRELLSRLTEIAAHLVHPAQARRPAVLRAVAPPPSAAPCAGSAPHRPATPHGRCIVVGASTGGPRAVSQMLKAIAPLVRRVPILLVQHMPPIFTTVFADQLSGETGLVAREGIDGERVEPGRVYLAPGGRHMGLAGAGAEVSIRIDDGPPVRHCRPAVDILFADAARCFGAGALGIVLTGMGIDGTDGARALVAAGGQVLAQDEATSTIWGMPGSVAKAGLARSVLALDALPAAIEAALGRCAL